MPIKTSILETITGVIETIGIVGVGGTVGIRGTIGGRKQKSNLFPHKLEGDILADTSVSTPAIAKNGLSKIIGT